MHKAMTQETPAKVLALLGTALASMMFLFLVSSTNASFDSRLSQAPMPRVSLFEKMERAADAVTASVGGGVTTYAIQPMQKGMEAYGQALAYGWNRTGDTAAHVMGVEGTVQQAAPKSAREGRVAGARTESRISPSPFTIDTIYSLIIR